MPHWQNSSPAWQDVCEEIGFSYIDPVLSVPAVISVIQDVECLITEALHGAIVADTFRIPWICVKDNKNAHTLPLKWYDWCLSMKLDYNSRNIPNLIELQSGTSKQAKYNNRKEYAIKRLLSISRVTPVISKESYLNKKIALLVNKLDQFKEDFSSSSQV